MAEDNQTGTTLNIYSSLSSRVFWIISFISSAILIYFFCFIVDSDSRFGMEWYKEPKSFFYDENENFMAGVTEYFQVFILWIGFSNHLYRLLMEIRRGLTSVPIPMHPIFDRPNTPLVSGKVMFMLYFTMFAAFLFGLNHWLGAGMALGLIGFLSTPMNYVKDWVN